MDRRRFIAAWAILPVIGMLKKIKPKTKTLEHPGLRLFCRLPIDAGAITGMLSNEAGMIWVTTDSGKCYIINQHGKYKEVIPESSDWRTV